jgi:hypothetical protein
MNNSDILTITERLAERLREDILLARTRDEHIRVTARANEAAQVVNMLRERVSNP